MSSRIDFEEETGLMPIRSLHPGIKLQDVQANIGFDLIAAGNIPETEQYQEVTTPHAGMPQVLRPDG